MLGLLRESCKIVIKGPAAEADLTRYDLDTRASQEPPKSLPQELSHEHL
jgi:hypothetical protein